MGIVSGLDILVEVDTVSGSDIVVEVDTASGLDNEVVKGKEVAADIAAQ